MTKDPSAVDDRFRSLLQKAVRRGHPELICTVSALIENLNIHSRAWFEKRAAFIVFSECWPLGREMVFTKRFPSKVAALIRVARAHKARDATGLGLLAYAFAKGDASVLNPSMDDRSVKLIAKAIRHPVDFWEWVSAQSADQKCRVLVANAGRYREGGRPHDKAVVQAAAFLAVSSPLPDPTPAPAADAPFPHWVVFDRHTSEGKRALRDVARDLHIPLPQLEWCFYFFEGAAANALPDPVPEEVKQQRWDRFMALQQQISADRLQAKIGRTIEILIDSVDEQGAIGRSSADAPEIDGKVYLDGITDLNPGDFVEAEVTGADEYDLWAG